MVEAVWLPQPAHLINLPHYTDRISNLNMLPLSGSDVHSTHKQKNK